MKTIKNNPRLARLLVGILIAGSCHAQSFLTNGLVAYYPFNGNASDQSGNGNDGVVHSTRFADDRFGYPSAAFSFDGRSSYISVASSHSLQLTTELTVSFWMRRLSSGGMLVCNLRKGFIDSAYSVGLANDGTVALNGTNSIAAHGDCNMLLSRTALSSAVTPTNVWVHVVCTLSPSASAIYLNGQVSSAGLGVKLGRATDPLTIGRINVDAQPLYYRGLLDDIRIYNRALSPYEIAQLYNTELDSSNTPQLPATGDSLAKPEISIPRAIISAARLLSPPTNEVIELSTVSGELSSLDAKGLIIKSNKVLLARMPLKGLQSRDYLMLLGNKSAYATLTSFGDVSRRTVQSDAFEGDMRQLWLHGNSLQEKILSRLVTTEAMRSYNSAVATFTTTYDAYAHSELFNIMREMPEALDSTIQQKIEYQKHNTLLAQGLATALNNLQREEKGLNPQLAPRGLQNNNAVLQKRIDDLQTTNKLSESQIKAVLQVRSCLMQANAYSCRLASNGIVVASSPPFLQIPPLSMRLEVDAELVVNELRSESERKTYNALNQNQQK